MISEGAVRQFHCALVPSMFAYLFLSGCSEASTEQAQLANLPTLKAQSELVRGLTPATPRKRFLRTLGPAKTSEEAGVFEPPRPPNASVSRCVEDRG